MRRLLLAVCLTGVGTAAAFAASPDAHVEFLSRKLSVAEQLWKQANLSNYSYTLEISPEFGTSVVVKVKVRNGACSAEMREYKSSRNAAWRKTTCEGITFPELFQGIRDDLEQPSVRIYADFDSKLGYVLSRSRTNRDVADDGSSLTVLKFNSRGP